ncbi:hypothetical protein M9Y10_000417 [Tritrichomonas musculus]|uniref:DUF3447 domain-containing protein n=1 Tax=Tritrichomonas musculus TaxID=1915356 RepID=A0ABR2L555_9EUKA
MKINRFVEKMRSFQSNLLELLEDESYSKDKYETFVEHITEQKIYDDQHELKALLYIIDGISKNHRRSHDFISNIEQVLRHFEKDIQKFFSNSEIFKIFQNNKRILLFLIEEQLMTIDEYIFSIMTSYRNENYCEYFQPEIKPFLTKEKIEKFCKQNENLKKDEFFESMSKDIDENFYEKRREGENDDFLCRLIRFNKIQEFITFVEQTNLSLQSALIKKSIFETNKLLTNKEKISLIEYASFYGSNDIIKYMKMKGVELTADMWTYAIHSGNAELIRYLEENHVSPPENKYNNILGESIECHHNEISNYFIEYLFKEEDLQNSIENKYYCNMYRSAVKSHNYYFFPENMKRKNMLSYLCEFDYYTLVSLCLEEMNVDINVKIKTTIF